jgi:segregation and condensation protein A
MVADEITAVLEPLDDWQRPDRFSGHPIRVEVYEGPLDLLLHLIRENQVDIYDIPLAKITNQYLRYLSLLESLNIEVAAEFMVMAATLMEIKSRLLLPVEAVEEQEEEEADPRAQLIQRLIEYQRYKEAAESLQRFRERRLQMFTRPAWADGGYDARDAEGTELALLKHVSVLDLLDAFRACLDRVSDQPATIQRDLVTVGEKIRELKARLRRATEPFTFLTACETCRTRAEVVATFLALLELIRRGEVRVRQSRMLAELWLRPADLKRPVSQPAPVEAVALSEAA